MSKSTAAPSAEFIGSECYDDDDDDIYEPEIINDWIGYCESKAICPYCGQSMLDDMEVGQGHHSTASCYLWATGQIAAALKWEATHND